MFYILFKRDYFTIVWALAGNKCHSVAPVYLKRLVAITPLYLDTTSAAWLEKYVALIYNTMELHHLQFGVSGLFSQLVTQLNFGNVSQIVSGTVPS